MAEMNCFKCAQPLHPIYKVRYLGKWYCTGCTDPVTEEYLEQMRKRQQEVRDGARIEDV